MLRNRVAQWIGIGWRNQSEWGGGIVRNTQPSCPKAGIKRFVAISFLFIVVLTSSIGFAFIIRNYSINTVSTFYSNDSATISVVVMGKDEIAELMQIGLENPEVESRLSQSGSGKAAIFLNYIVPFEWHFSDLPLEEIPEDKLGHYQPKGYNRDLYKILFTKAGLITDLQVQGKDIIKKTYTRIPLLVVSVNRATGKVMDIDNPPTQVRWGDIPTPLF